MNAPLAARNPEPPRNPPGIIDHAARSALQSITTVLPPPNADPELWSAMSSAEQLAVVSPASPVQLARAEVRNGRILVRPERSDFPSITLPNNVGAEGFSPGFFTHDYIVVAAAPQNITGPAGLVVIGNALIANPTPGVDQPSMGAGTRNDVGDLVYFDGDTNLVRSYRIQSPGPSRSVIVVNYTIAGEHMFHEGFVLRFAELKRNGRIVLITYGEGAAAMQSNRTGRFWREKVRTVWLRNAQEIFARAAGSSR